MSALAHALEVGREAIRIIGNDPVYSELDELFPVLLGVGRPGDDLNSGCVKFLHVLSGEPFVIGRHDMRPNPPSDDDEAFCRAILDQSRKRARWHPLFITSFDRARTRKVSDGPPIDGNWVEPLQIGRIQDVMKIKNISIKLWKEFNFNN